MDLKLSKTFDIDRICRELLAALRIDLIKLFAEINGTAMGVLSVDKEHHYLKRLLDILGWVEARAIPSFLHQPSFVQHALNDSDIPYSLWVEGRAVLYITVDMGRVYISTAYSNREGTVWQKDRLFSFSLLEGAYDLSNVIRFHAEAVRRIIPYTLRHRHQWLERQRASRAGSIMSGDRVPTGKAQPSDNSG